MYKDFEIKCCVENEKETVSFFSLDELKRFITNNPDYNNPIFWSVYGRDWDNYIECIGDFSSEASAKQVVNKLTPFKAPEYLFDGLCIWEAVLQDDDLYDYFLNGRSTIEAREIAVSITPYISLAWRAAATEGYEDCFDFEFVPRVLKHIQYSNWPLNSISQQQIFNAALIVTCDWHTANDK